MGLREHADLYHTVVWPHNPGQAVDDVMLTECILHTGCCSSLSVTILVHELACEVYPHSQTDVAYLAYAPHVVEGCLYTLPGIIIHRHLLIDIYTEILDDSGWLQSPIR